MNIRHFARRALCTLAACAALAAAGVQAAPLRICKSGKATLANRRRVGRKRLTPV